jgi:hypothetical protein
MDFSYPPAPNSSCGMRMASPVLSDSSTVCTASAWPKHDMSDIEDLFSHYNTACAVKAQAEKDLRAVIDKRRALALEEFRRAQEIFKKVNSVCDDMLRSIGEPPEVEDTNKNGMLPNVFRTAGYRPSYRGTRERIRGASSRGYSSRRYRPRSKTTADSAISG